MAELRPERPNFRHERPVLRPERPDLWHERPDLRPERPERQNLRPERPDLKPEGRDEGGMNKKRTNKWTNKSPPLLYRTLSPSGPLPKKSLSFATFLKTSVFSHYIYLFPRLNHEHLNVLIALKIREK